MVHLLLAVYLLTGLVGRGGFVLCVEGDSSVSLESLVQGCCERQASSNAVLPDLWERPGSLRFGDCSCIDYTAGLLLAHRLDLDHPERDIPAPLPCVLPPQWEAVVFTTCSENCAPAVHEHSRPDLPGAGASPRILRT